MEATLNRIAKGVAGAYRCEAEVNLNEVAEVCVNDEDAFNIVRTAIEKVSPGNFKVHKPSMGAEDFAYYTPYVKACYYIIGAKLPDKNGIVHPMHSGHVLFNEDGLKTGVAMFIQAAMDVLKAQHRSVLLVPHPSQFWPDS